MKPGRGLTLASAVLLGAVALSAQSLSYSSGQPVLPAYEGWEEYPDGTRAFVFGYMNRNWEEEVDLPIGPDNSFGPGDADRGQPTHFLPRRNRFVFRVPVPQGFTEKDELVWSLTTRGTTVKAYATLKVDYKMDDMIIASESGALGAGSSSPEVRANRPPVVVIDGAASMTVKAKEPLALVATVTDDGIPRLPRSRRAGAAVENQGSAADRAAATPPATEGASDARAAWMRRTLSPPARITVGKHVGLHVSWLVYRGAGRVSFSPEQIAPWEDTRTGANSPWAPAWEPPVIPADGRMAVAVTFDNPGEYVLRARADDGALTSDAAVRVTVTR
jgi:hypothetical protein